MIKTFTLLMALSLTLFSQSESSPNIVVIMADDLGYGDLSIYGGTDIKTPHIDQLMQKGLRFTHFRSNSSVCSPTRAAFITGCIPDNVGVAGVVRPKKGGTWGSWGELNPTTETLPEILKKNNYRTSLIGKWHLGTKTPNLPNERGFEYFHGWLSGMMNDYWEHRQNGVNYMRENQRTIETAGTHCTELLTNWAIHDINEAKTDGRPFFQYLAYTAPHSPVQPPEVWLDRVLARHPLMNSKRAKYVALVEHLDSEIGRYLKKISALGLEENTLIIFTSDNGGKLSHGASNLPFKGEKTTLYEGGIRVAFSATWPGKIPAKKTSTFNAQTMDIYPSILEACQIQAPAKIDGQSFYGELTLAKQKPFRRPQYFSFLQGWKKYAVIENGYKLVKNHKNKAPELFHLKLDPQEKNDLSKTQEVIYTDLQKKANETLELRSTKEMNK